MRALAFLTLATGLGALGLALLARVAGGDEFAAAICGPGLSDWTFDAWITAPLGSFALLYAAGTIRLWRRTGIGHAVRTADLLLFAAGWLALAAALVSPVHRWGQGLFAIHMIEHEVVMAIAAPLLVASRPAGALLWGLPPPWRRQIAAAMGRRAPRTLWNHLTRPAAAALLHGIAIWAWHAPVLFDAAILNSAVHRLQHLAFASTAIFFWWSLLRRSSPGAAVASLVLTMLHTSLLGALLALSPRVLYPAQTAGASGWGMTPLQDQQLAGLLMWVPAGTIYAAVALIFAARWIRRSGERWRAAGVPALP